MTKHAFRSRRWVLPAVVVVLWILVGGPLGSYAGKLAEVQQNDNAAFLPQSAESTKVLTEFTEFTEFTGQESIPATVVFERDGGLTAPDRQTIRGYATRLGQVRYVDERALGPPTYAEDGTAARLVVPIVAPGGEEIQQAVGDLRGVLADPPPGLTALVGGQGGVLGDFIEAFAGIDGILLGVALLVVLVILLVVYRSPILPLVVLLSAVLGLGVASAAIYGLASADLLDLNGQSQGILFILAVGAATDYSLLLVARFREELRDTASRFDAMRRVYRRALEPIVASGVTVILALLCLLLSDLSSLRGLGPVGALGIAAAMVSALTFLPMVLVLLGRAAFWPVLPRYGSPHRDAQSVWGRVARLVGRRARAVWLVTLVVLAGCAAFLPTLNEEPVPQTETFLTDVESVRAQDVLDRHFDSDQASPAILTVPRKEVSAAVRLARSVDGVVADQVSYLPAGADSRSGSGDGGSRDGGSGDGGSGDGGSPDGGPRGGGSAQDAPPPKVVDGDAVVLATLAGESDSQAATDTVRTLRERLDTVDPAIEVGGNTAILLDTRTTTDRDRATVIPVILVVIFLVLAVLLRALLVPALLLLANVLSFAATIGVSALLFNHVFDFPASDPSTLLIGFVFLVALGIDYSIFLMTRVREESVRQGTHPGVLKGLSVTGGVITSAGVVLAATFSALSVLPLLFLVQIAFIVAFGVLLDTLVVRSLLVPALCYDLGPRIWWPGRLRRAHDRADESTASLMHLGEADGVRLD